MMHVYQGNDELLMHRHKKIGTGNLLSPIPIFYIMQTCYFTSLLVYVSGNITLGVKCLASSKSINAYDIIITTSPT